MIIYIVTFDDIIIGVYEKRATAILAAEQYATEHGSPVSKYTPSTGMDICVIQNEGHTTEVKSYYVVLEYSVALRKATLNR